MATRAEDHQVLPVIRPSLPARNDVMGDIGIASALLAGMVVPLQCDPSLTLKEGIVRVGDTGDASIVRPWPCTADGIVYEESQPQGPQGADQPSQYEHE